ncbi:MAG TPA: glycoside hydrolase family 38 C-terminal domain-containing protein, partial [Rubrobacter sp.]|nr:glycoside hydrolase family 38 C-terminal domain-containing protein [Rubrobacter sp.]
RSAADRCDEYPEFVFTRGESWLFEQVERIDPGLFERVRRQVESGQWHITGGQYLQPDVNLSTVMGLHRQIMHGQRYFKDRFGVSPKVGYNVASFGHPATMPDVLASHGYVGYVFHRPGAHQVELPAQTFRWRGANGGEVIGFRISPAYVTFSDDLYGQIMLSIEAANPGLGHTMCFYGVGNHGGGPTKANIEYILENVHSFPDAELRFSTPQAFFDAIAESRDRLPVVTKELQHTFPGCYSVMHDIKQQQQRGEHLLDQCGRLVDGLVYDEVERRELNGRLDAAWDDLLFTEFHDVLAGTSIPAAWDSIRAMQGRARIIGEEVAVEATRRWAVRKLPPIDDQQIVVINPDDASWEGMVQTEPFISFDAWGKRWLSDLEGRPIDFQVVQPDAAAHVERVIFPLRLDARGTSQILVRTDERPPTEAPDTDLEASSQLIANSHLRAELDGSGIRRLISEGRDLLGEDGVRLHLRRDHTDTWTFHTDRFVEPVETVLHTDGWVVEESGPLRARVRSEGWLGRSAVRWTLTLHRDDPRIHISLEVNFNERLKLLQMPFHLAASPARRTDGLPGGHVERTAGPTEWPVQGWSRVELEDRQLALVTGDAYSLSLDGDRWQWTLLRSPKMAWGGGEPEVYAGRDTYTDQGPHTFDFVLYTGGQLDETMLHTAARQQMQPPVVFDRYEGMDRPPWGNSPPRALWLGAVERALADGRMGHVLDNQDAHAVRPLFERVERDQGE